jgi:glycosyltransferase involved in cell wall biosynthesis
MRLAFFCSSLEPAKDGVGDYTRRLSGELIRQGHSCVAVALAEPHISEAKFESQEIEGTPVSVLRLPKDAPWSERVAQARQWVDAFNPEWASLQLVLFGFHPKGLCFGLGKNLAAINSKASWHVMFHELWLGLGENAPVKHRIYGAMQRGIVLDMVRRLRPRAAHTQTEPYRIVLGREKIAASVMPLISNVPYVKGDGWTELLEPLVAQAAGERPDRKRFYLAGVFGAVYPEWKVEDVVNIIFPLANRLQKRLVLVFHGRSNLTPAAFEQMKDKLRPQADVIVTGERPGFEISKIMQALDLGLATTPRQVIQKSGSVAAMLQHGLQILVTRDDWRLRGSDAPSEQMSPCLLSPQQFASLTELPVRDADCARDSQVAGIARTMLKAMSRH